MTKKIMLEATDQIVVNSKDMEFVEAEFEMSAKPKNCERCSRAAELDYCQMAAGEPVHQWVCEFCYDDILRYGDSTAESTAKE